MSIDSSSFFDSCGLTPALIMQMARESGFYKRASGKINIIDFIKCICEESVKGTVSHNDLAAKIHATTGVSASRQAYWKRINHDNSCVAFFKAILELLMLSRMKSLELEQIKSCKIFKRIIVQDSTVIQLPPKLFEFFSGVKNATSTTCNARIQGVYDLCSGRFLKFSIDPYSNNDLSVASDIQVRAGDLILRDRGYFVVETFGNFKQAGADVISRYKHKTNLYNPEIKQKINLLKLLKQHGSIDMKVLVGEKKNIPLRLMAMPVSEEIANLRRMKAKKENHGVPSPELLQLMSWSIFIITIENPSITIKHVFILYGLRWRIENIFKTWKSNFNFSKIHNVSEKQLQVLLRARLVAILLFYHHIYAPLSRQVFQKSGRELSLMKTMRYLSKNFSLLTNLLHLQSSNSSLLMALTRYCTYDKRNRQHFINNIDDVFAKLHVIARS